MVVKMRIPSIIATLGTMYAARGLALVISGGNSIHMGLGKNFTLMGRGYLGGIPIIFIIMFLTIFFSILSKARPS
jgi:ribose/xylose/arabinose/galactoside ABC-type transport system permease subunit